MNECGANVLVVVVEVRSVESGGEEEEVVDEDEEDED